MSSSQSGREHSFQAQNVPATAGAPPGKLPESTRTFRQGGGKPVAQVFVSGTWKASKAAEYIDQGRSLGQFLARAGVNLACGPGTGIARHVIDGYRSEQERGLVRYYLPLRAEMDKVGETIEDGADEIIETDFDYPMRNVWQIKQSHGVFVLAGGDSTLEEVLPAVIDYGIPVAVVNGAGSAASALCRLIEVYPDWSGLLRLGPDVHSIAQPFINQVIATQQARTSLQNDTVGANVTL